MLPPDGFHNVSMDEYLGWPIVSGSGLYVMERHTPWHLQYMMQNPDSSTRASSAMLLGSVTHTAILEPDKLDEEYVSAPVPNPEVHTLASGQPSSNPRATAAYKAELAELVADNPGKEVIEIEMFAQAMALRDAVMKHKRAAQLLTASGHVELSAIATDPETGVRVKIRPDKLIPKVGVDLNLKTTACASYQAFSADVYRWGYHRSAALRKMALEWLGWDYRSSVLIAVETGIPPAVCVYELDVGAIDAGEQTVRAMLNKIAQFKDQDVWPSYDDDVVPLSLPSWAWSKVDEELDRYV